jgi:hypothetical protein
MALIKQSSKRASERPGLTTGGLVAAMLTAALISVFYLAWKVVGLPFVPFDAFDWMARILPGQILAAGIDAMVTVIRAFNLGPTAAAAKTAEHVMAIAGMFFMGLLVGTSLFSIIRAVRGRYAVILGHPPVLRYRSGIEKGGLKILSIDVKMSLNLVCHTFGRVMADF